MPYRIDEPCSEDWDAMEPHEMGRFCQKCQHAVVDATEMTKSEFERFFDDAQGDVCAQVRANPLGDGIFRRDLVRPKPLGSFVLLSTLLASACANEAVEPVEVPLVAEGCSLEEKMPPSPATSTTASSTTAETSSLGAAVDAGFDAGSDAGVDSGPVVPSPIRPRLRGRIRRR